MSNWVVIPCLLSLREEFNRLNPNRDKGADGTIGDTSHTSSSDHTPDEDSDVLRSKDPDSVNEVHALDVDSTGPWPGTTFDKLVKEVIAGEKAKWLDANDKCRLNYVIWNHYIYDKDNNFNPEWYDATSDPHTTHAHFSARYEASCEADTRPFLATKEDDVTKDEFMAWMKEFHAKTNEGFATWIADGLGGANNAYAVLRDTSGRTKVTLDGLNEVKATLAQIQAVVNDIQTSVDAHIAGLVEGK